MIRQPTIEQLRHCMDCGRGQYQGGYLQCCELVPKTAPLKEPPPMSIPPTVRARRFTHRRRQELIEETVTEGKLVIETPTAPAAPIEWNEPYNGQLQLPRSLVKELKEMAGGIPRILLALREKGRQMATTDDSDVYAVITRWFEKEPDESAYALYILHKHDHGEVSFTVEQVIDAGLAYALGFMMREMPNLQEVRPNFFQLRKDTQ